MQQLKVLAMEEALLHRFFTLQRDSQFKIPFCALTPSCILHLKIDVQKLYIPKICEESGCDEKCVLCQARTSAEGSGLGLRLCIGELRLELGPGWFLPHHLLAT